MVFMVACCSNDFELFMGGPGRTGFNLTMHFRIPSPIMLNHLMIIYRLARLQDCFLILKSLDDYLQDCFQISKLFSGVFFRIIRLIFVI
jgi:hypothetical protein